VVSASSLGAVQSLISARDQLPWRLDAIQREFRQPNADCEGHASIAVASSRANDVTFHMSTHALGEYHCTFLSLLWKHNNELFPAVPSHYVH